MKREDRILMLELALRPFAMAGDKPDALGEAFIWEPNDIMERPLVTFAHLRAARRALKR